MGIRQLYNDNLRKLPNKYGDVSVMHNGKWCMCFRGRKEQSDLSLHCSPDLSVGKLGIITVYFFYFRSHASSRQSWIHKHKFGLLMFIYFVILCAIGLMNSKTFQSTWKRLWKARWTRPKGLHMFGWAAAFCSAMDLNTPYFNRELNLFSKC